MSEHPKDFALEAFLEVGEDVAPDLPKSLLQRLYKLQKAHQFEVNREISIQEMQRALDEYLSEKVDDQEAGA